MKKPLSPDFSLADAQEIVRGARCWIVSDGKMGDLAPCLGLTERLGIAAQSRVVAPRPPFSWAMPWGPIDPREAPGAPESPIRPPFPDLVIGAGRRAAAYLRAIRAASGGRSFTCFLRDPRSGTRTADLIIVAEHDRLRGENVLVSLTSPHRFSPEKLSAARRGRSFWPEGTGPRVGLLLGGHSKDLRFLPGDIARLIAGIETLIGSGARIGASVSRRTPPELAMPLAELLSTHGQFFWDGAGENPYESLLSQADFLVVSGESTNMLGEAVATGTPVLVFRPSGRSRKIDHFLGALTVRGAIRPFQGRLEAFTYAPIDATPTIAIAIAQHFARHRARLERFR